MNKFKAGDKVKRVRFAFSKPPFPAMQVGDEDEVVGVSNNACSIQLKVFGPGHDPHCLEKVALRFPNPPHRHAELIKAWADGADVQMWSESRHRWVTLARNSCPSFFEHMDYRIKPANPNADKIEALEQTIAKAQQQIKELKDE